MDRKEAKRCLKLLSEKTGMRFQFEYYADTYWPCNKVPSLYENRKYGNWFMCVYDGAYAIDNDSRPFPRIMKPVGSSGLMPGEYFEKSTGGPRGLMAKHGKNWLEDLTSRLSGRTFASENLRVTVPRFSSYEELRMKLECRA